MKNDGPGAFKRIVPLIFLAAATGLLTTGCKTYQQENQVIAYWHQGDLTNAVAEAAREVGKNSGNKDAVIWRLEEGSVLRAAGDYQASNRAFSLAEEKMDDYAQKARVRLGQETGALLSNQANLDYEGRSYDGIMLDTYKALNYLALGEVEKARPEIIRAYQRQQEAVAANERRIEQVQQEAQQAKDKALMDQAEQNAKFQSELQACMTGINDIKVYADYVNPFTVYLDGIYFMANAADASDLERAHKSLERVASVVPDNRYVREDIASVNGILQRASPLPPTTYVIFETGCAPVRDQQRIDIPIVFSKVSYVGAAFPVLQPQGDFQPVLTVTAGGTSYNTETVASMDSIIALDYKNDLPVVITKTIAATVTKAVAAYVANDAARQQGDVLGLFVQMATAAYQMAVNIADTRTWTTLPKEFQVCRFPTPPDGRIELRTPNGIRASVVINTRQNSAKNELTSSGAEATLNTGSQVNVVYVKSINTSTPLLVSQFKL
jgi:hypothetical protein